MLNLPSIPTDSLYKFLFVGGLILITAAFIFSDSQYNTLKSDITHKKIDSLEFAINQTTETHKLKVQFITLTLAQLKSKDATNYLSSFLPKIYFLYKDSLIKSASFNKRFIELDKFIYLSNNTKAYLKKNIIVERKTLSDLTVYEDSIYTSQITEIKDNEKLYELKNEELISSLKNFNTYIKCCGIVGSSFFYNRRNNVVLEDTISAG